MHVSLTVATDSSEVMKTVQSRNVACTVVAEFGHDRDLLRHGRQVHFSGGDAGFDRERSWRSGWIGPSALRDPVPNDRVSRIRLSQLLPAAVGHLHRRL